MTLPNYLVIGAQKSATSSVCDLLAMHPDAYMCEPKEPYFFSNTEVWSKGFDWYESLFADAGGCSAIGEGSTTYSMQALFPEAPGRIARHLPSARLIYIVRNPFQRIESLWMHYKTKGGREDRPLSVAVREAPEYIDTSKYCKQIDVYREHFPDEQILVLFFEDFKADSGAVMRRVYEFLGIDPAFEPGDTDKPRHVSAEGRVDTPLLSPLRSIPGFRKLRDGMPMGLRNSLRGVLKKPIEGRPEWDEASRQYVLEHLAQDNQQFLRRYGKKADYWGFDWPG